MTTVNVVLGTPHIEVDPVTSQVSIVLAGPQGPPGEDGSAGGAGEWGAITGNLSDQTDLQAELDGKQDAGAAAGGVLAGTYPNPSFAVDMATQVELNAVAAAAVNDGDVAGGVLSGTYPNPGFAVDMATQSELNGVAAAAVNDGDTAGGVLSGTYPNPGFAVDMATQAELDAVSVVADAAIAPGDAAGGVLSGTYPNPGFASDMATQAEFDAHINDVAAAHTASAISYAGATGMSATDVEAAIDELAAEKANDAEVLHLVAAGASVENIGAVESNVNTVATSGSTETLDTSLYGVHDVTMDQACTFTFSNPAPSGKATVFVLILRGAFTPTWPASVDWPSAAPPTHTTPAMYTFTTVDGGTTWLGIQAGKAFG